MIKMKILTDFKNSRSFYEIPFLMDKQYDQVLADKNTDSLDYNGYFWRSQLHKNNCKFPKYDHKPNCKCNLDYNCKLFCYGTIIDKSQRFKLLGKTDHKMTKAILKGYEVKEDLEIYDYTLNKREFFKVIRKNKDSEINGFIIEFSVNELKVLDCYESDHYKRKEIIDQYGNKFWVYCENELWYEGSA